MQKYSPSKILKVENVELKWLILFLLQKCSVYLLIIHRTLLAFWYHSWGLTSKCCQGKSSQPPGGAPAQKAGEQSKEQLEEAKKSFLSNLPQLGIDGCSVDQLRDRIKTLHARISKLEADKYDLEKRHERQNYDVRNLLFLGCCNTSCITTGGGKGGGLCDFIQPI